MSRITLVVLDDMVFEVEHNLPDNHALDNALFTLAVSFAKSDEGQREALTLDGELKLSDVLVWFGQKLNSAVSASDIAMAALYLNMFDIERVSFRHTGAVTLPNTKNFHHP